MAKFAYEDMSTNGFEALVVEICKRLLGQGVQGFATGPDGGRDARFHGKANEIPSKAKPWEGQVIVQAKHTSGSNMTYSDKEFFSPKNKNCILLKEVPRIKKLIADKDLDFYFLFSNRRLSAEADKNIRAEIVKCGISKDSVLIRGVESIEADLRQYPEILDTVELYLADSPLIVSPDELAKVVEAFASQKDSIVAEIECYPIDRVTFEEKNAANQMDKEYAKKLRNRYLGDTKLIKSFLAAPSNSAILETYLEATNEFELIIASKRKKFDGFEEILEYLATLLFKRDVVLSSNKRLTRTLLFYMYWNCDIGGLDED